MDIEPTLPPLSRGIAISRRDWLVGATSGLLGGGVGYFGGSRYSHPNRTALEPDQIFQRVKKSVFAIEMNDGLGTGFCIDRGLKKNTSIVMTARHVIGWTTDPESVIERPELATVRTHSGDALAMKFPTFSNGSFDLFSCSLGARIVPLPVASQEPEIGETIYVLGHPNGIRYVFSSGIVSSYDLTGGKPRMMITAPISPGNSGGPVFNRYGEVVGMIVSTRTDGQNLNYAVPPHQLNAQREEMRFIQQRFESSPA